MRTRRSLQGPPRGSDPGLWPLHIKGSLWRMLIFAQVHLVGLPLRAYKYITGQRDVWSVCPRVCENGRRTTHIHTHAWTPPLLRSSARIRTPSSVSFLSSRWPPDPGSAPSARTAGDNKSPRSRANPPSCLLPAASSIP